MTTFSPHPLGPECPPLTLAAHLQVAEARAQLAALDSTARQLPNPTLFRAPALRREAQSTSALEGTYAPLAEVLTAAADQPSSKELLEILSYVDAANGAFDCVTAGRPITRSFLADVQGVLMRSTPLANASVRLRDSIVVIGQRTDGGQWQNPVQRARFIPPPPGPALETGVVDLLDWMTTDHSGAIDPVVAAAMAHYQFDTLHPFRDGNGRIGRLMIVLHLMLAQILSEPTLSVSAWFEARRAHYYDRLLGVSTEGNWSDYVEFFAEGLAYSARSTREEMIELAAVQADLKELVRSSPLRAETAISLVDFAVARPTFDVRDVEDQLGISYARANKLIGQLVEIDVLAPVGQRNYNRRFCAPRVLDVITRRSHRG